MELLNETTCAAQLFRAVLADSPHMFAVLVAKSTYRIESDGRLIQEIEGQIPILQAALETPEGVLVDDVARWKEGVDLLVYGRAIAPGNRAATAVDVTFRLGAWSQSIRVSGDRKWLRDGASFRASAPEPFVELPLAWERAFGGCAPMRGTEVPHPYNPLGRGYNTLAEHVEGTSLPNLEDPDHLVSAWNDDPRPLAPCPIVASSMFMLENCMRREGSNLVPEPSSSENRAHPKLRIPPDDAKGTLEIEGMASRDPLRLALPTTCYTAEVWLDDRHYSFPLRLDTIGVLVTSRRLFVTHRCRFTYSRIDGEARMTRLRQGERATA